MSKAQYTPGPWHDRGYGEICSEQAYSPSHDKDLAGMEKLVAKVDMRLLPKPEQDANARLIAAVPDLLAACEADLSACEELCGLISRAAYAREELGNTKAADELLTELYQRMFNGTFAIWRNQNAAAIAKARPST